MVRKLPSGEVCETAINPYVLTGGQSLKLTKTEQKTLIKILENTVERFEPEDLIHMIRGPKYRMVLDSIYDDVFRPHIKYGLSIT